MSPAERPVPVKILYGTGLILDTVKKMLEEGEKEAMKQGALMSTAIVDARVIW